MMFYEIFNSLCENVNKKPNTVGKELGIRSSIITQWKQGSIPSMEKIIQLADYFNVSADYLLGRTDKPSMETVYIDNHGTHVTGTQVVKNDGEVLVDTSKASNDVNELIELVQGLPLVKRAEAIIYLNNLKKESE